jgi:hypothetical protein
VPHDTVRILEVLGPFGGLAHGQDRGGRGDGVDDADDRLLGDTRLAMHAREREDRRADDREAERPEVRHRVVQLVSGQIGHGRAEGGDLGEREVDEDDPPLDHVHAEVGVNPREDQPGREWNDEKRQQIHYWSALIRLAMFVSKSAM